MHGIGNDYIYFDCFDWFPSDPSAVAVTLSDRHFSVGGDGVVYICRSETADGRMRMFNADGSEGKMCGNAIRCIGKFLYEVKGIRKDVLTVETESGVKTLVLTAEDGIVQSVRVDMGAAELALAGIESAIPADEVIWTMKKVGDAMSSTLKETAEGGLAATPTGRRLHEQVFGTVREPKGGCSGCGGCSS